MYDFFFKCYFFEHLEIIMGDFHIFNHFPDFEKWIPTRSPFPLKKREKEEGEKKAFMAIKTKYLDLVAIGQCRNIWSPLDGCGVISIFAPFHC